MHRIKTILGIFVFLFCIITPVFAENTIYFIPEKTYISFTNGIYNYIPAYAIYKESQPIMFMDHMDHATGSITIHLPSGVNKTVDINGSLELDGATICLKDFILGASNQGMLLVQQPHPWIESMEWDTQAYVGTGDETSFTFLTTDAATERSTVREILKTESRYTNFNSDAAFKDNYPHHDAHVQFLWHQLIQNNQYLLQQTEQTLSMTMLGTEKQGQSCVIKLPSNDLLILDTGEDSDYIHIRNEVNRTIIELVKAKIKPYKDIRIHVLITNLTPDRTGNLKKFLEADVYKPNLGFIIVNLLSMDQKAVDAWQQYFTETCGFQVEHQETFKERPALTLYTPQGYEKPEAVSFEKMESSQKDDWGLVVYRLQIDEFTTLQMFQSQEVTIDSETALLTGIIHRGYKTLFLSNTDETMLQRISTFATMHHLVSQETSKKYVRTMIELRKLLNLGSNASRRDINTTTAILEELLQKHSALEAISIQADNFVWPGNALYNDRIQSIMDTILREKVIDPLQIFISVGKESDNRHNLIPITHLLEQHNRTRMDINDREHGFEQILNVQSTLLWGWTSPNVEQNRFMIEQPLKADIRFQS